MTFLPGDNGKSALSLPEILLRAAASPFGLIVTGEAGELRKARGKMLSDMAVSGLAILGPDGEGRVWIVKKDALREHLL